MRVHWPFVLLTITLTGCTAGTAVLPNKTPTSTAEVGAAAATAHSVSLPALMQRDFDGRDFTLGDVLATTDAYTRYYLTYRSGGLRISGIMNLPHGKGPFPLLILNHGHIDTAIYTNGRGLKREQDYLARRGYAVVHPDYRNHAESDDDPESEERFRLGYTEDVINAILAVRAATSTLPTVDATRVGMLGHSMGGGVTLNVLVTRPDLVDAAVLFAPVSADVRDNFERWTTRRPELAQRLVERYGSPTSSPQFWSNLSAVNFFDRVTTPVLIHHGTADADVPIAWSQELEAALLAEGKMVTLHTYSGEPHEFIKAWPQVMQRTLEFFNSQLK